MLFGLVFVAAANTTVPFIHAADGVIVSGSIEGKKLELAPEIQTNLLEEVTRLLATSSNVVVQPKRTLAEARQRSWLELVFSPPRKFDLGVEQKADPAGVVVKDLVIPLPVCSGGVWIDSTRFRWFCSKFDTNNCASLSHLLSR